MAEELRLVIIEVEDRVDDDMDVDEVTDGDVVIDGDVDDTKDVEVEVDNEVDDDDVNVVVGDEKVEDVLVADIVSVGVIVEEVGTF